MPFSILLTLSSQKDCDKNALNIIFTTSLEDTSVLLIRLYLIKLKIAHASLIINLGTFLKKENIKKPVLTDSPFLKSLEYYYLCQVTEIHS